MDFLFKDETYKIIGLCMEVHNNLGVGFLEIVYKDALEHEFRQAEILYERENNILSIIKESFCRISFTLIL
nr:GxxExxY protein [Arachidicoccus sp. BS20]